MPRYRIQVEVPAGTPEDQAVEDSIEIDERYIDRALLFVPPGSAGTVNAELTFGEFRLLPTAESDTTVLPGTTDPAPVKQQLRGSPLELRLRSWAPNAGFAHTVTARIDALEVSQRPDKVDVVSLPRSVTTTRSGRSVTPQDIMDSDESE